MFHEFEMGRIKVVLLSLFRNKQPKNRKSPGKSVKYLTLFYLRFLHSLLIFIGVQASKLGV